jgi:hypothetical protein
MYVYVAAVYTIIQLQKSVMSWENVYMKQRINAKTMAMLQQ